MLGLERLTLDLPVVEERVVVCCACVEDVRLQPSGLLCIRNVKEESGIEDDAWRA